MNFVTAPSRDRELINFMNFMWSNQVESTELANILVQKERYPINILAQKYGYPNDILV